MAADEFATEGINLVIPTSAANFAKFINKEFISIFSYDLGTDGSNPTIPFISSGYLFAHYNASIPDIECGNKIYLLFFTPALLSDSLVSNKIVSISLSISLISLNP